jgi:hypothetical protein
MDDWNLADKRLEKGAVTYLSLTKNNCLSYRVAIFWIYSFVYVLVVGMATTCVSNSSMETACAAQ